MNKLIGLIAVLVVIGIIGFGVVFIFNNQPNSDKEIVEINTNEKNEVAPEKVIAETERIQTVDDKVVDKKLNEHVASPIKKEVVKTPKKPSLKKEDASVNKIVVANKVELGLWQKIQFLKEDGVVISNKSFDIHVTSEKDYASKINFFPNMSTDEKGYIKNSILPKYSKTIYVVIKGYAGKIHNVNLELKNAKLTFQKSSTIRISCKDKKGNAVLGAKLKVKIEDGDRPLFVNMLINNVLNQFYKSKNNSHNKINFLPLGPIKLIAEHKKYKDSSVQAIVLKKGESQKLKFTFDGTSRVYQLNFLHKDLNELPLICRMRLIGKGTFDTKYTNLFRKKGEPFELILKNESYTKFDISIKNAGYANQIKIPFALSGEIEIELSEGGAVSGTILDPDGKPLKDAKVLLKKELKTGFSIARLTSTPFTAVTNLEGKFNINSINPNRFKINVSHKNYVAHEEWVVISDKANSELKIIMKNGLVIEGTLFDQSRNPVEHAKIILKVKTKNMWGVSLNNSEQNVETTTGGKFSFVGLKAGSYFLSAEVDGVGHVSKREINIKVSSIEDYELILENSFQIKGKVVDQNGDPVSGIELSKKKVKKKSFMQMNYSFSNKNNISDENGEFLFDHLDDAEYNVSISSTNYRLSKGSKVKVQAGTSDLKIMVKGLLKISGKVFFPNGDLAKEYKLKVKYSLYNFSMPVKDLKKHLDGFTFKFNPWNGGNVKQIKVSIVATAKGYSEGVSKSHILEGDEINNIEIRLKENIACEVEISTVDLKKLENVEALFSPVSARMTGFNNQFKSYKVNSNGKIIVGSLLAVDYDILVKADGYALVYKKVSIKDALSSEVINFTYGSTVEGVVLDDNQNPVVDQKIQLKRSDLMIISFFQHLNFDVYTDKSGNYKFQNIPLGEYRIKKIKANKALNPMEIFNVSEGELIKIKKDDQYNKDLGTSKIKKVEITGSIKNSSGEGLSGMVFIMNTGKSVSMPTKMVMLSENGDFKIEGVKLGKYQLMFQSQQGANGISEKWNVEVKENIENIFNFTVSSERGVAQISSVNGDLLSGSAYFLKAGSINKNSTMISLFKNAISTAMFKEGVLKFKIPDDEKVDVYFSFRNADVSVQYFKNISVNDVLLKDWIVKAPLTRKLKASVKDINGNDIKGISVTMYDNNGIPLFYESNKSDILWDDTERLLQAISSGNSTIHFYKKGYAATKISITDNVAAELFVVLQKGFDFNLKINGDGEYLAYLLDDNKVEINRPMSQAEMVQHFMGGKIQAEVIDNEKSFKNYLPGKYFIKLENTKTKAIKISEVIELIDMNLEITMDAP